MRIRILSIIIFAAMLICILPMSAFAVQSDDIVILYENDVHCQIEGYSVLAALKNELMKEYAHVGVVTSGDFLQGSSFGTVSKGEYIVRLMNLVGYDAIALGNHEFDHGLERLYELSDMLSIKPTSSNFIKIGEGECFDPYTMVEYGDVKIAYIGITTPTTPEKTSFPTQFFDEEGNPIYTFSENDLAAVVQRNIDNARAEGADYVIALSHLGDKEERFNAWEVVSETVGLDVVLDAHSHSEIESATLTDKEGNEVVYTSTGTKFKNIGKLTISGDSITTELISLEEYTSTDPVVDECLEAIMAEYSVITGKKVAECEFDLITHDAEGNRVVRINESNLGNLIADAFRTVLGADVAYFNGGGIRHEIKAGEITLKNLLDVMPFSNTGVVVKVTGATIIAMLEESLSSWPKENGNFPHVSGITFSFNYAVEENRVYNVKIENSESGEYEAIDPDKMYTIASNNFILLECGDGMTMFKGAEVISDTGILDVEVFEKYIKEHLGGVIPEKYAEVEKHISFTDGEVIESPDDFDYASDDDSAIWIAVVGALLALATVATVVIIRKKKR